MLGASQADPGQLDPVASKPGTEIERDRDADGAGRGRPGRLGLGRTIGEQLATKHGSSDHGENEQGPAAISHDNAPENLHRLSTLLAETHTKAGGYPPSHLELLHTDLTADPAVEPSLSRVILDQVAAGDRPATVRFSRLGRVVAFGRRDTVSPGYLAAVRAIRQAGFPGMERLTGGRVAAHAEGTMVLAITTPEEDPARNTTGRFRLASELVREAFADLGVDARIGQIPGEYCPGEWSINGAGRIKLAGAGQRMIRGAVHLAFVIVASGGDTIRAVLEPVHSALDLEWDPSTAGAIDDLRPGTTTDDVEAAILGRLRRTSEIIPVEIDRETLELARSRADRFRPPGRDLHRVPGSGR